MAALPVLKLFASTVQSETKAQRWPSGSLTAVRDVSNKEIKGRTKTHEKYYLSLAHSHLRSQQEVQQPEQELAAQLAQVEVPRPEQELAARQGHGEEVAGAHGRFRRSGEPAASLHD